MSTENHVEATTDEGTLIDIEALERDIKNGSVFNAETYLNLINRLRRAESDLAAVRFEWMEQAQNTLDEMERADQAERRRDTIEITKPETTNR